MASSTATFPLTLPAAFTERLARIIPPEHLDSVFATFAAPHAVGFRINTLKASAEAVLARLADEGLRVEPVPGVPGASMVSADQRPALLASLPYAEGLVYVQNVSSQLPPLALDPRPGERVLDLCAAPGSKTRQLACLIQDEGEIVAIEKVRDRFYKLRSNLAEQGAACVLPVLASGAAYWHREAEAFDRVLVDVPCSTEGRFRVAEPETTRYWSLRKIKEMQAKQRKLLFSGIQALKPGGTLVYSTCTFAPEENEAVLDKALRTFGEAIEVVDAELPATGPVAAATQPGLTEWNGRTFDPQVAQTRRVLPDGLLEAFFVARLVKHTSTLRN
ncbi:MAG: RsmB/NOP family class I SAM-dependent RNA methyltransferase [Rhodothermaceae bacterium]|nr:RsmB/NOP family class I SAM-dependent RNA methyltransferase [Rhodothermaceae bacterium]